VPQPKADASYDLVEAGFKKIYGTGAATACSVSLWRVSSRLTCIGICQRFCKG